MSSRTIVVLLLAAGALGAGVLAWFALDAQTPAGPQVRAGTAQNAAKDGDPAATRQGDPDAPRRRRREPPPGVQADAVAVAGVVKDAGGGPVAGARVTCHLVPAGAPSDEIRMLRSVLGDMFDDGELEKIRKQFGADGGGLMGMRPGGRPPRARTRVGVGVGAGAGSGARAEVRVGADTGAGAGDADEETVEAGARIGMQIGRRMLSDPGSFGRLMRSVQLVGEGFEDDAPWPAADETTTDAAGAFRFEALPAGEVELRVSAPKRQRAKQRVKVGDLKVAIELGAAKVLVGEVRSGGRPLAGAQVRTRTRTFRTGGDGRFVYEEARPPHEPLLASAPGHAAAGMRAPIPETGEPELAVIELFPAGTVRGRVTARDGAGIPGAQVSIVRDGFGMFAAMMPTGGSTLRASDPVATSGADGSYVLEGLPLGKVRLRAAKAGWLDGSAGPLTVLPEETSDAVDFALVKESWVEGRVTDAAGAPVADATVGASAEPANPMMKMAAQFIGGSWRTARTDSDGRYRVGGVTEGAHDVFAEAAGHLRREDKTTVPAEAGVTVDFTLPPGHEVGGVVLAPDGQPAAAATVRISASAGGNPMAAVMSMMGPPPVRVVTGSDGRFTAKGLPEGPYAVSARAAGFLDASAEDVQPGQTDVTLRLGAAATIRGRVVAQSDGKGVAGATVSYRTKGGAGAPGAGGRGGAGMFAALTRGASTVASREDGTFEISGLTAGAYELSARGASYAGSEKVKVAAEAGGAVEGVELALPPGASVRGRVLRKGDGAPVPGALVYVTFERAAVQFDFSALVDSDPVAPSGSASANADAQGAFVLEGLDPGKVTVEVRAKGYAPATVTNVDAPGETTCEIGAGGAVEGTVYSKSGQPLEGATVILQKGMMGQGMGGMATSDRAGRYRVERLPPASYQAILMDPESPMGMGGMKTVAVRDGETSKLDFNQKAGGRVVAGEVLRDGKPFADVPVMMFGGSSGMQLGSADAQGRFRFEGVEPGAYTVTVQSQMMGGGNASAKVTVVADADPAPVRLELSGLAIEGVVVDAETGRGVPFAQVALYVRGGGSGGGSLQDLLARQRGQTFTGNDGKFRLESVPQGSFDLRATSADYAEGEAAGVQSGATGVKIPMTKGIELAVTVEEPGGRGVPAALVMPVDASGKEGIPLDMSASKQTGADGIARLRLPPGRWTLRVRAAAYPETTATVDAGQGQATVRLEDGGAIEVVAKNTAQQPVTGAKLSILDANGTLIPATFSMGNLFGAGDATDATGHAIRDGLRVGRVTVVVRSASGAETKVPANVTAGDVTKVEVTLSE